MGTLRGGNGDEQPPGGGSSDGIPDLPPEWGPVVIPDDPSALHDEAAAVRREMRRAVRRYRWRRRLRLTAPRNRDDPSLAVPLAIMAIAVVATLISLFAVAWPGAYHTGSPNPEIVTTRARPLTLPDLTLLDSDGVPVRLRDAAPAVVVLVDGCQCDRVVAQLAAAVDPRVSILVVTTPDPQASASSGGSAVPGGPGSGSSARPSLSGGPGAPLGAAATGTPPTPGPAGGPPGLAPGVGPAAGVDASAAAGPVLAPGTDPGAGPSSSVRPTRATPASRTGPAGIRIRTLLDPAGALRAFVPGLPAGAAHGVILLVTSDWAVVRVVPATTPVTGLKADLERLAS